MRSVTTDRFWKCFENLPRHIQRRAREAYKLWQKHPYHPSLHFKQIHMTRPIFSVRIGIGWRAVGIKEEEQMIWFWIGPHAEYDKLISKL